VFDEINDNEFKNLTRSTISLLSYWRDQKAAVAILERGLGIKDLGRATVHFEYVTPSLRASDKASYSDVMVLSPSVAIAVEGKWTEPAYQTVREWRTSDHRRDVLDHWLKHIEPYSSGLMRNKVGGLVYQSVHRCASVCAQNRPLAVLLYQVFQDDRHHVDYVPQMRKVADVIRPNNRLQVALCEIPLATTPGYANLKTQLKDRDGTTKTRLIREAVSAGKLFTFGEPRFQTF